VPSQDTHRPGWSHGLIELDNPPETKEIPMSKTAGLLAAAALVGGAGGTVGAVYAASTQTATTRTVTSTTASAGQVAERSSALTVAQIYRRDAGSVVDITVTTSAEGPFPGSSGTATAEGTGFVYDAQGDIVTNQHVVEGASSIRVKLSDGTVTTASLVGGDPATDLAVIHVDAPASKLHPLALGDSGAVSVGDSVVAIGSPFGLANTVTSGIVSAVGRRIDAPSGSSITGAIQTDAALNHGNSGGPLLSRQGRVIGVNAQIESSSGGNEGVGFAIPSSTVARVASQLIGSAT
jgi:putative serine protease PepD